MPVNRRSGIPMPTDWPTRRRRVLERDGHRCQIAGPGCTVTADAVDHIVPASLHGSEDDDNLQAVCDRCHNTKTAKEAAAARGRKYDRRRPEEPHPGAIAPGADPTPPAPRRESDDDAEARRRRARSMGARTW